MKVTIRREEGFDLAVYGMSLSFMTEGTSYEDWWTEERFNKLVNTAKANAGRDGGHNKMLESMVMWLEVRAPRFWWQEADTYRLTTKQSTGTMHTIQRRPLTLEDFEEGTDLFMIERFNAILKEATNDFSDKSRLKGETLQRVKCALPEGFLQTRLFCINYKTLRNMILQRSTHALKQWHLFIEEIYKQAQHPEFLPPILGN